MPLPSVDHARSISSCLAPIADAAQTAPRCRFLGKDSGQESGHCPERLTVAAEGWVCSQGSESNNRWCSISVSFSVVPSETASDFCSGIPTGGGPRPPLESEITAVFCLCHLQTTQEAPCLTYPTQKVLPQLLPFIGSWKGTLTNCLGIDQNVWQWQLQGRCVLREMRATAYGAWLQCLFFFFFFLPIPEVMGPQVEPTHRPPVVASHASTWPSRQSPWSVPAACRPFKRHHSPLIP